MSKSSRRFWPFRVEWANDESEFWEARFLCGFGYRIFIRIGRWHAS